MTAYDRALRAFNALCRCAPDQQRIARDLDRATDNLERAMAVIDAGAVLGVADDADEEALALAALTWLELHEDYLRATLGGMEGE